jgi:cytochrome P450
MGDFLPPLLFPKLAKSDKALIQVSQIRQYAQCQLLIIIFKYAWDVLRKRKNDPNPPNDLLQRLIEGTDEDGNQLPDEAIVSEMLIQM